jgi:proteasome lid subunit RPN8/RPN11
MVMAVEIPSAVLTRIMRSTWIGFPAERHERCGILRGRGERITRADDTANVAADPRTAFEIEPAALLKAYRDQRRVGALSVLGFFHTHPNGSDVPSERDAEGAAHDGKLWLIVTSTHARLWRAMRGGVIHGRFDPVAFDIRIGKRLVSGVPRVQHVDIGKEFTITFEPERFS